MMARLRFMAVALLALALAGNSAQTGRSEGRKVRMPSAGLPSGAIIPMPGDEPVADNRSCVIYSLTDMGYDADLGTWIAQTIPEMIEPSSWKDETMEPSVWKKSGGAGVLRYFAPKNILIVNHTSAVQTKVDDFLKQLKTSLPKSSRTKSAANKKPSRGRVVPAEYRAPAPRRISDPLPDSSSYPVAAPVKAPKHLFHFIIRYEGEGIIDDNVVKFMKVMAPTMKDDSDKEAVRSLPPVPNSLLLAKPPAKETKKAETKKEEKKDEEPDTDPTTPS